MLFGATPALAAGSSDIGVTKSGPAAATAGGTITYTITVTNNGPDDATNLHVADTLPADVSFQLFNFGPGTVAGTTCSLPPSGGGGSITCTYPSLNNGQSATFSVVTQVLSNTPDQTTVTNQVTFTGADQSDPNPTNNTSSVSTLVMNTSRGGG